MKSILWAAMLLPALMAAGTVFARDGQDCALSYDVYEISVPHTDLAECPAVMDMSEEDTFCRASLVAEVATVFAFSYETNCLVAARNFHEDEFTLTFD